MITVEQAEKVLSDFPLSLDKEEIPLRESLRRILAGDLSSPIDMPPFDKSAMDGFALKAGDAPPSYRVVEVIPAGKPTVIPIVPGTCARIMTGAMLPAGADRVIKKECTREENGFMRIIAEDDNPNILRRGEDIRAGEPVLRSGTLIRQAEIALLASLGIGTVPVFRKPLVGIVTTGAELIPPGRPLQPGQIYDSNSFSIESQTLAAGADSVLYGTVDDDADAIRSAVTNLTDRCRLVILSGGVSAGDFDFVPGVLRKLGVTLHFEKISVQPGMPTVFGSKEDRLFFGLPGNPVSTFVIFEVFIKPFLFRLMGHNFQPLRIRAPLAGDYQRKKGERTAFIPAVYRDGAVSLADYHGSAHLNALSWANALVTVPSGIREIRSGSIVDARLL